MACFIEYEGAWDPGPLFGMWFISGSLGSSSFTWNVVYYDGAWDTGPLFGIRVIMREPGLQLHGILRLVLVGL